MNTTQMTLVPADVEFQPDGKALVTNQDANVFLTDAFAEFGEVTLTAGDAAAVNVNCTGTCGINLYCPAK